MTGTVLIIEDQPVKATAIKECILEVFPGYEITTTDTIAIAGQLLENRLWNGIILDLAFHKTQRNVDTFDRPYLAGVEILQQIKEMRLDFPVIVATQHSSFINTKYGTFENESELIEMLSLAFPRNFVGFVKVDLGETDWRKEINALMEEKFK